MASLCYTPCISLSLSLARAWHFHLRQKTSSSSQFLPRGSTQSPATSNPCLSHSPLSLATKTIQDISRGMHLIISPVRPSVRSSFGSTERSSGSTGPRLLFRCFFYIPVFRPDSLQHLASGNSKSWPQNPDRRRSRLEHDWQRQLPFLRRGVPGQTKEHGRFRQTAFSRSWPGCFLLSPPAGQHPKTRRPGMTIIRSAQSHLAVRIPSMGRTWWFMHTFGSPRRQNPSFSWVWHSR